MTPNNPYSKQSTEGYGLRGVWLYNYKIKHIPEKANTPADALSRPPNANQGEQDNKNITVIPLGKFVKLAIFDNNSTPHLRPESSEEQKQEIMVFAHTHPLAGHSGRDETIWKAKQIQSWKGINSWITNYVKGCVMWQ